MFSVIVVGAIVTPPIESEAENPFPAFTASRVNIREVAPREAETVPVRLEISLTRSPMVVGRSPEKARMNVHDSVIFVTDTLILSPETGSNGSVSVSF